MSTNISGNVDVGGLLSHEYLRVKNTNKNKPLKGQKLSALKDAVTLQKEIRKRWFGCRCSQAFEKD